MIQINEDAKKVFDTLVDYFWNKTLEKMSTPPYLSYEDATAEVQQEMMTND